MDHFDMQLKIIQEHGGKISCGINWTWAKFPTHSQAKAAFDILNTDPFFEHRGLGPEDTDFRFR